MPRKPKGKRNKRKPEWKPDNKRDSGQNTRLWILFAIIVMVAIGLIMRHTL